MLLWYPTQEDDLFVLASALGWAPNLAPTGSTPATSVALPIVVSGATQPTFSGQVLGTLHNGSSVHVYRINAGAGVASVTCDVASAWSTTWQRTDLNCRLRVFVSDGATLLATINPAGYATAVGLGTGNNNVNLPTAGK
jgi:hypothetical protein